jgi:hypothetical protein
VPSTSLSEASCLVTTASSNNSRRKRRGLRFPFSMVCRQPRGNLYSRHENKNERPAEKGAA